MPPPLSASNFGQKCSRPRARAIGGCGRGWPSGQGAGAGPAPKCLSDPGDAGCVVPMSRPHRLWDTGQTTLWLLTGSSPEGLVSWPGSK